MVASDEEQIERLRDWWEENRRAVIAAAVLGVVALAGWFGWQNWQDRRVASASQAFAMLEQRAAADGDSEVVELARDVATTYDGTSYAPLAWLIGAAEAVERNDLETAAAYLERVPESTDTPQLVAVAELRLARVLWSQGEFDAALSQLQDAPPGFDGRYAELRGDILLDQGKPQQARAAYELAAASGTTGGSLGVKLDSLPKTTDAGDSR
jgi:predicted negative regulator of RcsB-dependent stress response